MLWKRLLEASFLLGLNTRGNTGESALNKVNTVAFWRLKSEHLSSEKLWNDSERSVENFTRLTKNKKNNIMFVSTMILRDLKHQQR